MCGLGWVHKLMGWVRLGWVGWRKMDPRPSLYKTYIWNAEMTKVIVRCLLLDWNHWMPVHAKNFYFYLWLLKILWPENTSLHISRHLEFIIEQGHRVNWVSGSLNFRVTESLVHKMWPSSMSSNYPPLIYSLRRVAEQDIASGAARGYAPHRRWQFDGGVSFRCQSGHYGSKIAADPRPSANGSTVRTSLVAGGG